ncbi:serine kinase [bacterium]|nr:serine kinase [bacterium]
MLKLKDIIPELELKPASQNFDSNHEVTGGYASDLLSDVIANAEKNYLWITLQTHENIIAVAVLKELAGIILINDREPDPNTLSKAEKEGIALLLTPLPAFEVVGRLYQMGLRGL